MTTVTDKTIAENREARWDVDFKVGQKDSRFAYEWDPGVQYETPQIPGEKKMLRVLMNVFVEWQNSQGQVMPWDVGRWYYEYRRP